MNVLVDGASILLCGNEISPIEITANFGFSPEESTIRTLIQNYNVGLLLPQHGADVGLRSQKIINIIDKIISIPADKNTIM